MLGVQDKAIYWENYAFTLSLYMLGACMGKRWKLSLSIEKIMEKGTVEWQTYEDVLFICIWADFVPNMHFFPPNIDQYKYYRNQYTFSL